MVDNIASLSYIIHGVKVSMCARSQVWHVSNQHALVSEHNGVKMQVLSIPQHVTCSIIYGYTKRMVLCIMWSYNKCLTMCMSDAHITRQMAKWVYYTILHCKKSY